MKTTIGNVCEAYKALTRLLLQEIPLKEGVALSRLRASLRPDYEYACMEENKAIEAFGAEKKDGHLFFQSTEQRQHYYERIAEITAAEIELNAEPVDISKIGGGVRVNFGALEGFITF